MLNGPESWFMRGAARFEKDPTLAIVYTFGAIGFGGFLTYVVNIPGLSPVLANGMGTFPPSALLIAGTKMGVVLVELVQDRHQIDLANPHQALSNCVLRFRIFIGCTIIAMLLQRTLKSGCRI